MGWVDRLQTIVITATVTSVAWILAAGTGLIPFSNSREEEGAVAASAAPALETLGSDGLLIPVLGIEPGALTDTYNDSRSAGARVQEAIDIMAPRGASVVAAATGTIDKLFLSDDGGNTIYVRSPDRRTIHYYAHLDGYADGLMEGQPVTLGQPLGTVGSTGNADGSAPHLHFAILRTTPKARWSDPGTAVNPYPFLVRDR